MTESETRLDDCCAAEVDPRIGRHFDKRLAELTADGQLPDMIDVSAMLLELLDDADDRTPSVLELGCGSGALSVALLERGAARVDGVDLSADMVAAARRRADEAGVTDRASFTLGDGALVELAAHDWVILDRAICCYPNVERLLGNALSAARSRVAFTVPTSRGWRGLINRVAWRIENIPTWLRGNSCPTFVHDQGRIDTILGRAGFERAGEARLGLWYGAVWERRAPAA